jgi:S1-C subfamily serine protease
MLRVIAVFVVLHLVSVSVFGDDLPLDDFKKTVNHARRATVTIYKYDRNGNLLGSGTGFFVSSDGWVLTCFHVTKNAYSMGVRMSKTRVVFGVLRQQLVQPGYDYAAFRIPSVRNAPYLKLSTTLPKAGTDIFAVGAPLGNNDFLTFGKVSRLVYDSARRVGIETTGISWPGSSGSPVMNVKGEVIGMTASGTSGSQNKTVKDKITWVVPAAIIEKGRQDYLRINRRR